MQRIVLITETKVIKAFKVIYEIYVRVKEYF